MHISLKIFLSVFNFIPGLSIISGGIQAWIYHNKINKHKTSDSETNRQQVESTAEKINSNLKPQSNSKIEKYEKLRNYSIAAMIPVINIVAAIKIALVLTDSNNVSNQYHQQPNQNSQIEPKKNPDSTQTTQTRRPLKAIVDDFPKSKENPANTQNNQQSAIQSNDNPTKIAISRNDLNEKIKKNGDEPSLFLELQNLGSEYLSIADSKFSKDLINEFPVIESFFLKKLKDETNPHILKLKTLLNSFNFKERPPFEDMTTFDFLMIALLVGGGHFYYDCPDTIYDYQSFGGECPELQIITLEALNPIMVELYQDPKLPLSLRTVIKNDYIHRIGGCLLDHRGNYIAHKFGEENWQKFFIMRDEIKNNSDKICAMEILEPLINQANKDNLKYLIDMDPPITHNGTKAFEWIIASLGYNMKLSMRLLEDCALKIDPEEKFDIRLALTNQSITELASILNVKITVYQMDKAFNLLKYVRGPKDADVELKIAYQSVYTKPSRYFQSGYILS